MSYAKLNIDAAEDIAPKYGMDTQGETRIIRDDVGAKGIGMSYYRWKPGKRTSFGHTHEQAEEMYLVLRGSGRMKVDDEIVDFAQRDVIYVSPGAMREWEAGPDGADIVAFGHHFDGDATMTPGWWTD
ncbi:MAG TPA: cupin domain-containing protein [Solirubrobacteraceae bacterium]